MVRPIPDHLFALREQVAASYCWWGENGKPVSEQDRSAMGSKQRTKLRWAADQAVIDELVAAEREFTATFKPARPDEQGHEPVLVAPRGQEDFRRLAAAARRHPGSRPLHLTTPEGRIFSTGVFVGGTWSFLRAARAAGFVPPTSSATVTDLGTWRQAGRQAG